MHASSGASVRGLVILLNYDALLRLMAVMDVKYRATLVYLTMLCAGVSTLTSGSEVQNHFAGEFSDTAIL